MCPEGFMLLGGATWFYDSAPRRADYGSIAALGLCLYLNQLLYILGLQLAGVTLATCLQPSIPVVTVILSMLLGLERVSVMRTTGAPSMRAHSCAHMCCSARMSGRIAPLDSPIAGTCAFSGMHARNELLSGCMRVAQKRPSTSHLSLPVHALALGGLLNVRQLQAQCLRQEGQ